MPEEQPKFLTALSSFFPIFLLLVIDFFAFGLQPQPNVMSHLALSVLTAQLICLLAFIKGEICNGQRSRLAVLGGVAVVRFRDKLSPCIHGLGLSLWLGNDYHHMEATI